MREKRLQADNKKPGQDGESSTAADVLTILIRIASALPYAIEDLLRHTPGWVRMVYEEVEKNRLEELRMQLAMRGIDPNKVLGTMEEAKDESKKRIVIAEKTLGTLGLSRTIIKRGKA